MTLKKNCISKLKYWNISVKSYGNDDKGTAYKYKKLFALVKELSGSYEFTEVTLGDRYPRLYGFPYYYKK